MEVGGENDVCVLCSSTKCESSGLRTLLRNFKIQKKGELENIFKQK